MQLRANPGNRRVDLTCDFTAMTAVSALKAGESLCFWQRWKLGFSITNSVKYNRVLIKRGGYRNKTKHCKDQRLGEWEDNIEDKEMKGGKPPPLQCRLLKENNALKHRLRAGHSYAFCII